MWSIGCAIPWDTGSWEYMKEIGEVVEIYDQSAQGVEIGDMWWQSGHGRLIENVWRDSNGIVQFVEVSESNGYLFATQKWTADEFNNVLQNVNGKIYRYVNLYKNIKYKQLPFVHIGDETGSYTYNDDICTYGGEKACFREGFKIVLNYNLKSVGSWSVIQVYEEDDTFVGEYQIDSSLHSYDISSLNLSYGKYKARLSDGVNNSEYTHFEILQTNVSFEKLSNDVAKISFSSANGLPLYIKFHKQNGGPKATYALTEEDLQNGFCVIDFKDLIARQYNNLTDGDTYCKVTFVGDYGRVTNDPININN